MARKQQHLVPQLFQGMFCLFQWGPHTQMDGFLVYIYIHFYSGATMLLG